MQAEYHITVQKWHLGANDKLRQGANYYVLTFNRADIVKGLCKLTDWFGES